MSLLSRRLLAVSNRSFVRCRNPKVRLFSDSALEAAATTQAELIQGSNTQTLGEIVRHGKGDACITLSVGGTEFFTLRSTVQTNAVLADHVARAEANSEVTHNGAVFIDRDPEQFGLILRFLRNQSESLTYSGHQMAKGKAHVQLPNDMQTLRDLYVEATYYRIPRLQAALCKQNWVVGVASVFGGGNPFTDASNLLARLRTGLVAFGGAGTLYVGAQRDFEKVLGFVGLQKKDDDGEVVVA